MDIFAVEFAGSEASLLATAAALDGFEIDMRAATGEASRGDLLTWQLAVERLGCAGTRPKDCAALSAKLAAFLRAKPVRVTAEPQPKKVRASLFEDDEQ